jgi:hypothetical protein
MKNLFQTAMTAQVGNALYDRIAQDIRNSLVEKRDDQGQIIRKGATPFKNSDLLIPPDGQQFSDHEKTYLENYQPKVLMGKVLSLNGNNNGQAKVIVGTWNGTTFVPEPNGKPISVVTARIMDEIESGDLIEFKSTSVGDIKPVIEEGITRTDCAYRAKVDRNDAIKIIDWVQLLNDKESQARRHVKSLDDKATEQSAKAESALLTVKKQKIELSLLENAIKGEGNAVDLVSKLNLFGTPATV